MPGLDADVQIAALLLAACTFLLQRRRERRISQATLLREYTTDFYSDDRITRIFMAVDHERFRFQDEDLDTDNELALIRLLGLPQHAWSQLGAGRRRPERHRTYDARIPGRPGKQQRCRAGVPRAGRGLGRATLRGGDRLRVLPPSRRRLAGLSCQR